MKAFVLFFLRKFFWDCYDHLFVVLFLNFIYTLLLFPFYGLLLAFFNQLHIFFLVLAFLYGALISPLFMPLVGFLHHVTLLEEPSLTVFWGKWREISWKKCWFLHLVFFVMIILFFFNVQFYMYYVGEFPFLVAVLVIFFFLGLFLVAWYGVSMVFFYEQDFSWKRLRTLAAVIIEYGTFLFPWIISWLFIGVVSYIAVLPLLLFFPAPFFLFMTTFLFLVEKNYELKEKVLPAVRTKKEFLRRYHYSLRDYYERHADEDGHYSRSLKDLIRPWRG